MFPYVLNYGPIKIGSYGVMLAISFLLSNVLMRKELVRKGIDPQFGEKILMATIIAGVAGSKILYLFENFSHFLKDPIGMTFSGGGFTAYGGFSLAMLVCFYLIRKHKYSVRTVFDAAAPAIALGYGLGRLGCFFAGDGCYGTPTDLPWGMSFPNGIVPTNETVHPTPIYEMLYNLSLCGLLWAMRKHIKTPGNLIFIYFVFTGLGRFLVEFIRLNEELLWGLRISQIGGLVMIAFGTAGLLYNIRLGKPSPKPATAR